MFDLMPWRKRDGREENYHRIERAYGIFSRTLALPTEVDPKKVDTSFKDGVLKVVLHKTKEAEAKKIAIETQ